MPQPLTHEIILALIGLGVLAAILISWVGAIAWKLSGHDLLPPPALRVVPWDWKTVVGLLLLLIGVQILFPPIYLGIAGITLPPPGPNRKLDPGLLIRVSMASNVVFLVLAAAILRFSCRATPADFGLEPRRVGRDVFRGVAAWPLLYPFVFAIGLVATRIWPADKHPLEVWVRANPAPSTMLLAGISAAVVAPICEEFLFRGLLLGWLGRIAIRGRGKPARAIDNTFHDPDIQGAPSTCPANLYPDTEGGFREVTFDPDFVLLDEPPPPPRGLGLRLFAANVAVSLIFAGLHAGVWPTPIPLFLLSLGLGLLYQRTGSLIAPITLHAVFNGITTSLFFVSIALGVPEAPKPIPDPGPVAEGPVAVVPVPHARPLRTET